MTRTTEILTTSYIVAMTLLSALLIALAAR
jgi:hypothetical protein